MPKPTREQLAHFFIDSDVFKGVNVEAALNEFFDKIYPEGESNYAWCVFDGKEDDPQFVGIFSDLRTVAQISNALPNCWEIGGAVDELKKEIESGCKAYYIKVWDDERVEFLIEATTFREKVAGFRPNYLTGTFFAMKCTLLHNIVKIHLTRPNLYQSSPASLYKLNTFSLNAGYIWKNPN